MPSMINEIISKFDSIFIDLPQVNNVATDFVVDFSFVWLDVKYLSTFYHYFFFERNDEK